jgi:hypothetical protein
MILLFLSQGKIRLMWKKSRSSLKGWSFVYFMIDSKKQCYGAMVFSILAAIIGLHIMNDIDLSAIIDTYKLKRKRIKAMHSLIRLVKRKHPCFTNEI